MKPPVPQTADIEVMSQDAAYDGRSTLRIVNFRHRRLDGAWSAPLRWELWQRGRAAAMVPYDPVRDEVVMIEQFRLPNHAAGLSPVLREIPAGLAEPDETDEATIRREMQEEAGLTARRIRKIGDFILSAGTSDEMIALFVGEVDTTGRRDEAELGALRDASEDMRVLVLPALDAIEQAIEGRFHNSVASIGLLWLAARREALRREWA